MLGKVIELSPEYTLELMEGKITPYRLYTAPVIYVVYMNRVTGYEVHADYYKVNDFDLTNVKAINYAHIIYGKFADYIKSTKHDYKIRIGGAGLCKDYYKPIIFKWCL